VANPTRNLELAERIWAKIERWNGHWLWIAGRHANGYGGIKVNGRYLKAHRVVYELLVGPIPDGLELDHLCRVRFCVNPSHLEPVTHLENVRRSPIGNGAKTHCPQGHLYDEANTYRRRGRRECRTCHRLAMRSASV
jgi:hypothetical protein